MNIFLIKDDAFIDLGKGYLLCIGSKDEVLGATEEEVLQLIQVAIAMSKFKELVTAHTIN